MFPGGPLPNRGKRPYDYVTKSPADEGHHSPFAKVVHGSRHEPLPSGKGVVKPRSKATKLSSAKAANLVGVVGSLLYEPLFIYVAGLNEA